MRRLGSRTAQVGYLPQATAPPSRPLPPRGARSRDPRSRKGVRGSTTQRGGQEGGEAFDSPEGLPTGRRGRWRRDSRRRGGRDATVPSSLQAKGPTGGSRPPHIRVSGDTQLLLPPPPSLPRRSNAKLPATTATPRPSDGSYLGPSWARLRNAPFLPEPAQLTCPEDEDGRHARCV